MRHKWESCGIYKICKNCRTKKRTTLGISPVTYYSESGEIYYRAPACPPGSDNIIKNGNR